MQLQGMQAIAFVMVATGNYLDTGNGAALVTQLTVYLPSIGACCRLPRSQSSAWTRILQRGTGLSVQPCHRTFVQSPTRSSSPSLPGVMLSSCSQPGRLGGRPETSQVLQSL